jgi:hypothetical protein
MAAKKGYFGGDFVPGLAESKSNEYISSPQRPSYILIRK